MIIKPITDIAPINPVSVYYENRISDEKKLERTIAMMPKVPHITYDKFGNLIEVPDQSFNLGTKYV